ncbi:MAG: class F sortase [Candidatus Saccharimonadales bacterium]
MSNPTNNKKLPSVADLAALQNRGRMRPARPALRPAAPVTTPHYSPRPVYRPPVTLKATDSRQHRNLFRRFDLKYVLVAILVAGIGGFIAVQAVGHFKRDSGQSQKSQQSQDSRPDPIEGSVEEPLKPGALDKYTVPADEPRRLSIPKLSLNTSILSFGLGSNKQPRTAINIYESTWFSKSAKPGAPGTMLIQGHIHGPTKPGAFSQLKQLAKDDQVEVEAGDGTVFTYKVVSTQISDAQSSDLNVATSPAADDTSRLMLATFAADTTDATANRYIERVIVLATLVSKSNQ